MYVSLVLKAFANNSLIEGIEVRNTNAKGLVYVIRKALTHALQFFENEVSNPHFSQSKCIKQLGLPRS